MTIWETACHEVMTLVAKVILNQTFQGYFNREKTSRLWSVLLN